MDGVPQLNGVPLPDIDLDSIDKPWQKPGNTVMLPLTHSLSLSLSLFLSLSLSLTGADITDYFNYGFTEDTWKLYCDKQRKMRYEAMQLSKLVVSYSHFNNITVTTYNVIIICSLSIIIVLSIYKQSVDSNDDDKSPPFL